jgi:hypothetical protein
MKLRPHHIYCYHFTSFADPTKGKEFTDTQSKIANVWGKNPDRSIKSITIQEGADTLCAVCPYFDGTGCTNPNGGDEGVRKWDARLISELDIHQGQTYTIDEINELVNKRRPLNFCLNRCPYYKNKKCDAGINNPGETV